MKREAIVCEGDGRRVRLRRGALCLDYDLRAGRFSILFGDGPAIEHAESIFLLNGSEVRADATLPHRWHLDELRDPIGRGRRLVIEPATGEGPIGWTLSFDLYEQLDGLAIGTRVDNRSADEIELREVQPLVTGADGRLRFGDALKTTRILPNAFEPLGDEAGVRRVDSDFECESAVSIVLADVASSTPALALGALAGGPMRAFTRFYLELLDKKPPSYRLRVRQATPVGCSRSAGVSIPPDGSFAPERILLVPGRTGFEAFETYADLVGKLVGKRSGRTPCGWSSWPYYQGNISEGEVLRNATCIDETLKSFGLELMTVDAGWQKRGHASGGPWTPGEHFPHGMAWLADEIHRLGLRAGIWIRPLEVDGLRLDPSSAFTHTTLRNAARQLTEDAGFDALKIDAVHDDAFGRDDSFLPDDGAVSSLEAVGRSVAAIRDGIGAERVLAGSSVTWGSGLGLVESERVGREFAAKSWRLIKEHGVKPLAARYAFHGRWWVNDPGPVVVRSPLTLGQARAWASVCALGGGLITTGDRLYALPDERLEVLKRVLPAYGACARPLDLFEKECPEMWSLPVEAGGLRWHILGLFNWDTTPQEVKETKARTTERNRHRLRANDAIENRRRPRATLERIASSNKLIREENKRLDRVMNGHALGGPKLELLEPIRSFRASARFRNVTVPFDRLGLEPGQGYLVYDFWDDRFLGLHGDRLKVLVRLADCVVLAIHPALGVPQLISTNRHVTQGGVDLEEVVWNEDVHELCGISRIVENDEYAATIYVPREFEFMGVEADIAGVQARHQTPSTVRLRLQSLTSKPVRWKLKFNRTAR